MKLSPALRGPAATTLCAVLAIAHAHARQVPVATYAALAAACTQALPGDTITIAPGVYTVAGATRIMIAARPGPVLVRGSGAAAGDVVIQGNGQDDPSVEMIFNLDDSPRWTFEHLTTRNSYYHGFKFDHTSTDCVLRDVVMMDHGESGVKGTSDPAAGTYPDRVLIEGCTIGFTHASGGTRSVVEGVDAVGVNDWIIRGNRFLNVQKGGNPAYAVFTKGNSSNTIIEGNAFVDCFIGASFGGGGTGAQFFRDGDQTYEHRNGIIRNNIMIRCSDAAVYVNKGTNCRVYNNTVYQCELTIQLRFAESSGYVRNNLVIPSPTNPSEPAVRMRDGAALLANDANMLGTTGDVSGPATAGQPELPPVAGSKAVDGGVDLHDDVPFDYAGTPRPQRAGFDIGAFELRPDAGIAQPLPGRDAWEVISFTVAPDPSSGDAVAFVGLRAASHVVITLHDLTGRMVATPFSGDLPAGTHAVPVRPSGGSYAARSAVMLLRVVAGGRVRTVPIVVVR
ncbi:MAG: right-handed parallel beta-helix repeat-containing protein [Bacteroidetes bacterium]|nr:right-handed parallel beta-helix repeat-containing protein [Bacteroidota bacterium]